MALPQRRLRTAAIALAGIISAALCLQISIAGVYRSSRPQTALKAAPGDAAARAKLADRIVNANAADLFARARSLALDAIRRDPLQPSAIRVLALVDEQGRARNGADAIRTMEEAQRLSKRDLATQRWLIDNYSRNGNRQAAIRQLDLALRSAEGARAQLFPLLDAMTNDQASSEVLLRTLSKRPNWTRQFAVFMIEGGRNLNFAQIAAKRFLDPTSAPDRDSLLHLVKRFADDGRYDAAWALYTDPRMRLRKDDAGLVRNGSFERAEDGSPFDWTYAEDGDLWAGRQAEGSRTVLQIGAANGRAGAVAHQTLRLSPGVYRLNAVAGNMPPQQSDRPTLKVACASASAAVLVELTPSASSAQGVGARFEVPKNCSFQVITIWAAGQDALPELLPWIDEISLVADGLPRR